MTTNTDWRTRGACNQYDPEMFFPHPNDNATYAKRVCKTECPVASECLTFALENVEEFGVWGGMTEQERRALGMKSRDGRVNAAQCGSESGYRRHLRRGEKSCAQCLAGKRLADQLREERRASA